MKKRITIDEDTLKTLDFLIGEHMDSIGVRDISKSKLSKLRQEWIEYWVETMYKEYNSNS